MSRSLEALVAIALVAGGAAAQELAPAKKPAPGPKTPAAVAEPLPDEAVLETDQGSITLRLLPGLAPRHVAHFAQLTRAGGYEGTTFHRVIARGIIQGGDPLSKDPKLTARYGQGGLGLLKAEFSSRAMTRGSVAAVLRPNQPDSGGDQFFICLSDQPALTGRYTIFGEVADGMDVADKIGETPVEGDRAAVRVEIKKVTLR